MRCDLLPGFCQCKYLMLIVQITQKGNTLGSAIFRKTVREADDGLTGQIGGQELGAPIGRCYNHIIVFDELMKFFDEQRAQPIGLDVFDGGDEAGGPEDIGP